MSKTVLIAGKEFPFCAPFVNYAVENGFNAMVTLLQNEENPQNPVAPVASFVWNRSSPISARSLVLETENTFGQVDYAFLIFDTASYIKKFERMSAETLSRGMDTLFAGYMYLCLELVDRLLKKGSGNICFILEKHPGMLEAVKSNARGDILPAGPLVSAAEAAFKVFAENLAVRQASTPIGIHLIECLGGIDEARDLVPWLYPYLETASANPIVSLKNAARWVHPGAKSSSGWQLFGR